MPRPYVIVDLIDADGCVYNHYYDRMLIWLGATYRMQLAALNMDCKLYGDKHKNDSGYIEKVKNIRQAILKFNFADLENNTLLDDHYTKFFKIHNEADSDAIDGNPDEYTSKLA